MSVARGIHPSIYVLLGCPGSGKGTFAQAIKSEGYDHVSTGDITREELKNKTEFGLKYQYAILNPSFEKCGKIYNAKFSPPTISEKCDVCHGALTGRLDDNIDGTKKRVYEFQGKMRPVIEYYTNSGRLSTIDGNAPPEICLDNFFNFHHSLNSKV